MAAIYFPPSIGVSHASQLEDYPKCTMVNELPACLPDPLIIVDEIIYFTSKSTVFSATCQDKEKTKLAIKFSPVDNLLTEAFVYDHLEDLQGKCIPKLYGMFFGKTIQGVEKACIITHYVGERLNTFLYKLPRQDRADILSHLSTIHAHGYSLPDLAERNILKAANGSYWLIDFENAVVDKKCSRALDFHLPGSYNDFEEHMCWALRCAASDMLFWDIGYVQINHWFIGGAELLPTQEVIDSIRLNTSSIRSDKKARECARRFFAEVKTKMEKEHVALQAIQDDKENMLVRISQDYDKEHGPENALPDYRRRY